MPSAGKKRKARERAHAPTRPHGHQNFQELKPAPWEGTRRDFVTGFAVGKPSRIDPWGKREVKGVQEGAFRMITTSEQTRSSDSVRNGTGTRL